MNKPRVLITANHNEHDEIRIYGPSSMQRDYIIHAFYNAGLVPLLYPAILLNNVDAKIAVEQADIVVISGGFDVAPEEYGEELTSSTVKKYSIRDKTDMSLITAAIELKKPVFGICRGMQVINVYFKGSLHQDIKEEIDSSLCHEQKDPYGFSHKVTIEKNSFLSNVYDEPTFWVNSAHHQTVKKLGKNLKISAKSSDGLIEAIEHESLPIYGVQWHPELSHYFDQNSKKLLHYFKELAIK